MSEAYRSPADASANIQQDLQDEVELARAKAWLANYDAEQRRIMTHGARLAKALLHAPRSMYARGEKRGTVDHFYLPQMLAHALDYIAEAESDDECLRLTHEWMWERYWGLRVVRHLSIFDAVYQALRGVQGTQTKRVVWEDIDKSAWIEPHDTFKIVAVECGDDNVYLFIHDGYLFHGRNVWPRATRNRYPTLASYRKEWRDAISLSNRGQGYLFTLEPDGPRVREALTHYVEMRMALWTLRHIKVGLDHTPCPHCQS